MPTRKSLDTRKGHFLSGLVITGKRDNLPIPCYISLFEFSNCFGIDVEESFYAKMEEVKNRQKKDLVKPTK